MLTVERLYELLYYNLAGGLFRKPIIGNVKQAARWAGEPALTSLDSNGNPHGMIQGKIYLKRNVIWAMHYGAWAQGKVYQIDGDKTNCAVWNLRCDGYLADVLGRLQRNL